MRGGGSTVGCCGWREQGISKVVFKRDALDNTRTVCQYTHLHSAILEKGVYAPPACARSQRRSFSRPIPSCPVLYYAVLHYAVLYYAVLSVVHVQ